MICLGSHEWHHLSLLRTLVVRRLQGRARIPSRRSLLEELHHSILKCKRCELRILGGRPIPGRGKPNAPLMIIGEAPNSKATRPFESASGKLLIKMLLKAGLSLENIYITNLIKCTMPSGVRLAHDYIKKCGAYLRREILLVRPSVIVPLGRIAVRYLLEKAWGKTAPLHSIHGKVYVIRIWGVRMTVIPMYHPAVIFYNPRFNKTIESGFSTLANLLRKLGVMSHPNSL